MKVSLVNNGKKEPEKLRSLLSEHQVTLYDATQASNVEDSDLIVLSGSSRFPIMGNEDELEPEYSLVLNARVPIIGICYGAELIARAFGGTLVDLGEGNKERDLVDVEVVVPHPMFGGRTHFQAYDAHRWTVEALPHTLELLARSKHGPEVFRHRIRPVVGFQFHPEKMVDESYGDEVFRAVLAHYAH
ncbi:gamma-glutamyl-gamma-aminobutyrate hydrolase family protein [Patescibacteria group bacterium]|nr:gamma-glutamyl-gamma-aminobutyrate hydrolase family protein [Patescibacteria group bacterium]